MKKRWIVLAIVAAAVVAGIGVNRGTSERAVTVKTAGLQPKTVEQTVVCSGKVEADDVTPITVPAACVVREVLAEAGQAVKKGDPLITVDKKKSPSYDETAFDALRLAAMEDTIRAPEDGIVSTVEAEDGKPLKAGEVCCTVVPRRALQVRIAIREKYLPSLKLGQTVRIKGDGFSRKSYLGELTSVSSAAKTVSAGGETVVEGVVSLLEGEADESFRLGLTAKAHIVTSTTPEGILIPYAAVFAEEDGQECVYTVRQGRACRVPITAAAELSGGLLLDNADLAGETVILEPERVKDRAAVEAEP